MTVNLKNIAERVFHIAHPIRLVSRIIFADWHALFAAMGYDLFHHSFNVWILNAEMEESGLPEFEIIFWLFIIRKLENLDSDLVAR